MSHRFHTELRDIYWYQSITIYILKYDTIIEINDVLSHH